MVEAGSGSGAFEDAEYSEFLRISGLRLEKVGGDMVRGWIDLDQQHHTPWGVVHGGVYAAAVESAASLGASAAVKAREQFAVGVNNNTDFLRHVFHLIDEEPKVEKAFLFFNNTAAAAALVQRRQFCQIGAGSKFL